VSTKKLNLTGHRYGKLIVVEEAPPLRASRRHVMWRCRCDCGREIEVRSVRLRGGHTTSCGCLAAKQNGLRKHPLYGTWIQMMHRCMNPDHVSYANYGGRGVKVCERWRDLKNFVADMGPRPSVAHQIDRFPNNDGNYEPGNVRWALPNAQMRNTRANRYVTIRGEKMVLAAAAELFGVPYWTAHKRLRLGWTEEQALGVVPRRERPSCG
jgi:hypothetical protein